jgi:hypothetical protein
MGLRGDAAGLEGHDRLNLGAELGLNLFESD